MEDTPGAAVREVGTSRESDPPRALAASLPDDEIDVRRLVEQHASLHRVATTVAREREPTKVFEVVAAEAAHLLGGTLA
jgi:hypothetical protein